MAKCVCIHTYTYYIHSIAAARVVLKALETYWGTALFKDIRFTIKKLSVAFYMHFVYKSISKKYIIL